MTYLMIVLFGISIFFALTGFFTLLVFMRHGMMELKGHLRATRMILNDAILSSRGIHNANAASIARILDNSVYTKNFCEEYSWRLVHFTDDELAALAEGEAIRQEKLDRGINTNIVEWPIGFDQPRRLPTTEPLSLVPEQEWGQDVRDDTWHQDADQRPISDASSNHECPTG